jgi:hypothetical protein
MKKNFGMNFGLPRRGVRGVLPAILALTAASVFCVSSAKADVTTWSDFSDPNIDGHMLLLVLILLALLLPLVAWVMKDIMVVPL